MLDKVSGSCILIYKDARNRHVFVGADPQHRSDDGLVAAFDGFASTINELHDTAEELSDWIATHYAVLQPTTGQTFDSIDCLFDFLLDHKK